MEPHFHPPYRFDWKCSTQFTKRITSLSSLPYSDRLALLDLELLELRRLRFDLIYYYKVLNYLTPFNPCDVFTIYVPAARPFQVWATLSTETSQSHKIIDYVVNLFYRNIDVWNNRLSGRLLRSPRSRARVRFPGQSGSLSLPSFRGR